MSEAELVLKTRTVHARGIVEMVVWQVPKPVPPSEHSFKYRLVFVREGKRLVGYDNERGKGDHKHLGEHESLYKFVDIETLMADFLRDVEAMQ
ncbi:MAG: DUF6516 family protein [Rhodoferax sp.]